MPKGSWTPEVRTCRKCGRLDRTDYLFYLGKRYYIHPKCGLEKWGAAFFGRLHLWQLRKFPFFLAKDAEFEQELRAAIRKAEEQEKD